MKSSAVFLYMISFSAFIYMDVKMEAHRHLFCFAFR
uniref:Uncharacterized protein n=1 Tax=Siphoviridae sp. ctNnX9 TaxID=2827859 RepID=A0A8S5TEI3_9CAUD|nr:MAG TPA: hypothetical protein [Siphoviridae sp. ctNnX9]